MKLSLRKTVALFGLLAVSACSAPAHVDAPQVPMGNFRLGHNIVVVSDPELLPFSRKVEDEVWQEKMTSALAQRFGEYEGDKIFHLGVKVEGYALAVPGVPLLFTPKSVLVLAVNIWDDAAGEKLTEEAESFTVFESLSPETMISSGLTQSKEKQMKILTENAAKVIQDWILAHPEWVGLPPLPDDTEGTIVSAVPEGEISEVSLEEVIVVSEIDETDGSSETIVEEETSN